MLVDFAVANAFFTQPFNGWTIRDAINNVDSFTDVTINPATNMVGLDASRITWDADNIWVNWHSLSFTENTIVSLDINSKDSEPIPEPATVALLGIGLAGLAGGAARRKWKKKAVDNS